jgi:hypothetical protein
MLQVYGRSACLVVWLSFSQLLAAQDFPTLRQEPVAYEGLTDKTLRFASDAFGAGAVYLSASGQAFLWMEDDYEVLTGVWTAYTAYETIRNGTSSGLKVPFGDFFMMDFSESRRRFDLFPDVGRTALISEVGELDAKLGVVEKVDSDVLRLQDGTGPCRVCREGMTISELLALKSP